MPRRTERPPASKQLSPCGMYMVYYFYMPFTRKNGETTYHKHTKKRKLVCINTVEKNKCLHELKRLLSHTPEITLANVQKLLSIAKDGTLKQKLNDLN